MLESELVAGFMTEHGASIFVFFFLGEYSSLILMSAFMSIFFLGGHHCPDLHKLILDPILFIYNNYLLVFWNWYTFYNLSNSFSYYNTTEIHEIINSMESNLNTNKVTLFNTNLNSNRITLLSDILNSDTIAALFKTNLNSKPITLFSTKYTVFGSINILIDKIYGSYILGFKIIVVVFFYIWVRASFPRLRYDQLMSLCWKELLPLSLCIYFIYCVFIYTFDMMPFGINF